MSELMEKNTAYAQMVREIGESYLALGGQAYAAYAPLVDDICGRVASGNEVDHFLDYLMDGRFCESFREGVSHAPSKRQRRRVGEAASKLVDLLPRVRACTSEAPTAVGVPLAP